MGVPLLRKGPPTRRPPAQDKRMVRALAGRRYHIQQSNTRLIGRPLEDWLTSWVGICIEKNATAVAQQSLRLYREDNQTTRKTKALGVRAKAHLKMMSPQRAIDEAVEVTDHPFLTVLDHVNPLLNRCDLWWLTTASLLIGGNAYWKLTFDGLGRIIEIWPLPQHNVWLKLGGGQIIESYEYRCRGGTTSFDPDEIVHFRKPSPLDLISGIGPLRTLLNAAETNLRMQEWENALFQNEATPASIVSLSDGDSTEAQAKQLSQDIEQRHGGWRNRGKIAVFPGGLRVERLSDTAKDLKFPEGRKAVFEQIAAGFGVPVPVLMTDGVKFNNMRNGLTLWTRQTIQPLLVTIAETLNARVMPYYSESVLEDMGLPKRSPWFVSFDDPTPDDVDADTERYAKMVATGIWSPNEIRLLAGWKEAEWGDEPLWPGGVRRPSEPVVGAEGAAQVLDGSVASGSAEVEGDAAPVAPVEPELETVPGTDTPVEPITFSEITLGIERLVRIGDEETVNMLRDALADMLGQPRPADAEVAPGVVNPNEHESLVGADLPPVATTGAPVNGQPVDESSTEDNDDEDAEPAAKPPKKKPAAEDKGKPDKAAAVGGHEAGGVRISTKITADVVAREIDAPGFADALREVLSRFESDVETRFKSWLLAHTKAVKAETPEYEIPKKATLLSAILNEEKWVGELVLAGSPFIRDVFEKGGGYGRQDLATTIGAEAGMLLSTELIEQHIEKLTKDFASEVVDVKGDALFDMLSEGLKAAESPTQLFERVAHVYQGEKGDYNAERIARTELSRAMHSGVSETWKAAGVKENEWVTSVDACEFCALLSGKRVLVGKAFASGGATLRGPSGQTYALKYGDVRHPPLHPHCTCTVAPVVEVGG